MPALLTSAAAVLAGLSSSAFYLVGLSHSLWGLFLMLCCALPLYIAGAGWGSRASGLAGVLAVAVAMALGDPLAASIFSVIFVIPAFVLTHIATQPAGETGEGPVWLPVSPLIRALVAIGLIQVGLAALVLSFTDAGLIGTVRGNLARMTESLYGVRGGHGGDAADAVAALVDFWDSMVLGTILAAVLISHAAMGALAQGLVVAAGTPRRPTPSFWRLRLPGWMSVAALVLAAAVFGLDVLAGDREGLAGFLIHLLTGFLLVLCTGFLLQGLAVLHALTRGMGAQPLILVVTYAVVIMFQPFGAMAFVAIGLAEHWAGFRERFGVTSDVAVED